MIGAQAVVEMLRVYGVKVIFGVPGDTSLPLYDALYQVAPDIQHILARDERSAAFMADAYARLSGYPAVCECPSGAGTLYSIPGIAEANASSIPVILLTSGVSLAGEGKGTITELDHHKLMEPVTKWSSFLKITDKIPETIRKAFRIATTGRPGAVHLVFPTEVMANTFTGPPESLYAEIACSQFPAYRTRGNSKQIQQLAKIIASAKKPVIITGGGAVHSGAGELVIQLAEHLSAPVVTTISGQGIMPDDHPLALGVTGDNGYHPHAHQAIEKGDTLLYIGCKMGSVSTVKWSKPNLINEQQIIQIDIDSTMLGNAYKNTLSIAGDSRLVLEDLIEELRHQIQQTDSSAWVKDLNKQRSAFWEQSQPGLMSNQVPIKPKRVVDAINRRLSAPSVVIADAGTPTPYITRFLKLRGKGSRFLIPRAYGGLGYVIPALVGAHLARPEAKIIGMFGDGSLGMSAGELETLARLNIPALMIHFNNGVFGWIKALQSLHSESRYQSVDFTGGDMAKLATVFGIQAFHVTTPEEMDSVLDIAMDSQSPVFVDIVSESEVADLPPVYSWEQAAKKLRAN